MGTPYINLRICELEQNFMEQILGTLELDMFWPTKKKEMVKAITSIVDKMNTERNKIPTR